MTAKRKTKPAKTFTRAEVIEIVREAYFAVNVRCLEEALNRAEDLHQLDDSE